MIRRRAIDASGSLGSFYDMCRDCVLNRPKEKVTVKQIQPPQPIRCELMDGNTEKSNNILKMIGIDDDHLRLNILLTSTRRTGIAAVVNHPRPVDKRTRFLYILYEDREERLSDDASEAKKNVKPTLTDANSTHIIAAVSFGIDILIVLQLPDKEQAATRIDTALNTIRARLDGAHDFPDFIPADFDALKGILETTVYSNVTDLATMKSLYEICRYAEGLKRRPERYCPLTYTFQTIDWLYPNTRESQTQYTLIEKQSSEKLEEYLIEILEQMKKVKHSLDSYANNSLPDDSKEFMQKTEEERQELQEYSQDVIKTLADFVCRVHSGEKKASEIDTALKHPDLKGLKEKIRQLKKKITDLEKEIQSNNSIRQQTPMQTESFGSGLNSDGNNQNSDHTSCAKNGESSAVGQNDKSTEQKTKKNEGQQNPTSPSSESKNNEKTSPTDEILNILLLGESGVGKSTFINAFVNYLKFKTFDEAESSKPVVVIPVSFLITTGNNFEERTVKFGDLDSLNNEDFDHPGQSVTQQCKSYLLDIDRKRGFKYRIIDTPGFGDTRGIDRDELNMQHILEYINHFDHFNAVCFLLKPNTSRINNFFRICLTQLLDLLGSDIRQNIIFCFTNARSTFYTPGDTAPLLKDILKSSSMSDIPFKKHNTFCFDNESFRYLVSLQNGIEFEDQNKAEYEMSWFKSVDESKRLRDYICDKVPKCYIRNEKQSIKRAQIQITHMIRPILEAIRNIIRNMIIYEDDSLQKSIELNPKHFCRPAALCFTCKRDLFYKKKVNFWIVCDEPHEIQKQCFSCDCDLTQHKFISYKLEYKFVDKSTSDSRDKLKKRLNQLCNASVELAYFLTKIARSSKDDPFLMGIIQMIGDENGICERKEPKEMNLKLVERLRQLLTKYEQRINDVDSSQQHSELSVIYDWIQTIGDFPEVTIQMEAVKKTQVEIMRLYECKVSKDRTNTAVRSKATS